jgi:hypothetical protein
VIWDALDRYLGFRVDVPSPGEERHEALLRRSLFGHCEQLVLPGREDIIRTPESVLEMFFSTSFAAPDRFGSRLAEFKFEVLGELRARGERFWDWPGDTEVLIATKS